MSLLKKIKRPRIFILSLAVFYGLSFFQFYQDFSLYKNLAQSGIVVNTCAEFIPKKFDVDYYKFTFKTLEGQIIAETGKCGDRENFDEYYSNLQVVYAPGNPGDYLKKPDFDNYSLGFKIFFYFGLYGLCGTFVSYGFLKMTLSIYNRKLRTRFMEGLTKSIKQ